VLNGVRVLALLSLAPACVLRPLSPDGRACPCGVGYTCDGETSLCVALGADLGVPFDLSGLSCPADTALVPPGTGFLGTDDPDAGYPDETPIHEVTLGPVCVDRLEVTVANYRACVTAAVCTAPSRDSAANASCNWSAAAADREMLPVNCVSWPQAKAFCEWAGDGTIHAGGARRLLTEAEWERQARLFDRRTYPWGEIPPTCMYANMEGCSTGPPETVAVGSYPAGDTPLGVKDVAGNVAEWVADFYSPTYYLDACANGCTDPMGPADGGTRVYRGGSFQSMASELRTARRRSLLGDDSGPAIGIRCGATPQ
jgi:formylglycine-generating enzyme required for sulfatase activity